jgi:hypothetical protein
MAVLQLIPDSIVYASNDTARAFSYLSAGPFLMLFYARSCFQPSAEALLKADPRPPVLFLRSFIDDERMKYIRAERSFMDASLESRIAKHFSEVGPFIAIGSPSDRLPTIGAARASLSDAEWQGKVLEWMDACSLLVVMAGATHWIAWELRKIVERGHVGKLILLFPQVRFWYRKRSSAARLAAIKEAFVGSPWESALHDIGQPWRIRSLVFEKNGHVSLVVAKSRNRNAYHLAALIAHFLVTRDRLNQPHRTNLRPKLEPVTA